MALINVAMHGKATQKEAACAIVSANITRKKPSANA